MNIKELAPSNDCYYCIHGYQGNNRLAFKDASQNPCNECGDNRKYFEKRDLNSTMVNYAVDYLVTQSAGDEIRQNNYDRIQDR